MAISGKKRLFLSMYQDMILSLDYKQPNERSFTIVILSHSKGEKSIWNMEKLLKKPGESRA